MEGCVCVCVYVCVRGMGCSCCEEWCVTVCAHLTGQ